jgi:hypothetical protein
MPRALPRLFSPSAPPSTATTNQFVGAALSYTGGRPGSAPVDAALTYPGYAPPTTLAAAPPAPTALRFPEDWRPCSLDSLKACHRGAALTLVGADVFFKPGANLAHTRCSSKSPKGLFRRARAHFWCFL